MNLVLVIDDQLVGKTRAGLYRSHLFPVSGIFVIIVVDAVPFLQWDGVREHLLSVKFCLSNVSKMRFIFNRMCKYEKWYWKFLHFKPRTSKMCFEIVVNILEINRVTLSTLMRHWELLLPFGICLVVFGLLKVRCVLRNIFRVFKVKFYFTKSHQQRHKGIACFIPRASQKINRWQSGE